VKCVKTMLKSENGIQMCEIFVKTV
jgi:hypothetical protein